MRSERGVGPVVGVILVIAVVISVAATVAVFGAAMLEDTQSDIEHSQTETAFSQLSVSASELRENGDEVSFDLGHREGQVRTRDDTGHLEVRLERATDDDVIYNTTLRSLVYERDGQQVAYQGGGVFSKQTGGTRLVSSPEFFYRDNSLVFPVTVLEGDLRRSGQLDGSLRLSDTKRIYPTGSANRTNPLEEGTIFIELESEYCQGWEEYFGTQTRGSIVESCGETGETVDGELKVELSVPFELESGTFTNAVKAQSYDDGDITGVEEGENDVPSADSLIQQKAGQCKRVNASDWGLEDPVDESGLYCVSDLDSAYEFDTTGIPDGEEIEVYVDGDVDLEGKGLPVNAPASDETRVSFYVNGSFDMEGKGGGGTNRRVGNDNDATQTHIFVSSDGYVGSDDGSSTKASVYALLYAPNSDAHFQSNFEFKGAMVVEDLSTQGFKDEYVEFEPAMTTMSVSHESAGPEFYYLHLVEKRITVGE